MLKLRLFIKHSGKQNIRSELFKILNKTVNSTTTKDDLRGRGASSG